MPRALALVLLSILLTGCGGWGYSVENSQDRRTPLERAAQAGNLNEVQQLLAHGADPNDRNGVFGSPLNSAAGRNGNAKVIRTLLSAGANPNGRGQEGNTCWASPLWTAASRPDLENLRTLLDSGAVVNSKTGCSKLAVGWLKSPVIDLLVQHGLNIFATDQLGRNELHIALGPPVVANLEGVQYLVRAGVPLNARDHKGKTPLAYWREPRDFEAHVFGAWLAETLSSDPEFKKDREERTQLTEFLERSGALL